MIVGGKPGKNFEGREPGNGVAGRDRKTPGHGVSGRTPCRKGEEEGP